VPNGDDDMGSAIGSGTDEGGGMFTEPGPPSPTDDDDAVIRSLGRRHKRRRGRGQSRAGRRARRGRR
jgi:hypothetical protein